MIRVGTSGYSYDDWVGRYYPERTPKIKFLDHYAQEFNTVEVNFTYYRMPTARTLAAMAAKTGPGFKFSVKATGSMTHERGALAPPEVFAEFRQALQPLIDGDKFACVLAQFPHSFRPTGEARSYLEFFREQLPDLPVVIEFRHSEWAKETVFGFLRKQRFGFCCVDEPRFESLMPGLAVATSRIGYVRFHGRNYQKWWHHAEAWERYNYLYPREELAEWLPKISELQSQGAEDIYLYFNNHYQAQAVENARMFQQMLGELG